MVIPVRGYNPVLVITTFPRRGAGGLSVGAAAVYVESHRATGSQRRELIHETTWFTLQKREIPLVAYLSVSSSGTFLG